MTESGTGRGEYAPDAWARGGPITGLSVAVSTVLIDASEASALDLEAEGFVQLFADWDTVPEPTADLYLVLPTPYDLELVRVRDFDPALFQLPAIMAGTFSKPHSARWLAEIEKILMVIVLPGLVELQGQELTEDDLRPAWVRIRAGRQAGPLTLAATSWPAATCSESVAPGPRLRLAQQTAATVDRTTRRSRRRRRRPGRRTAVVAARSSSAAPADVALFHTSPRPSPMVVSVAQAPVFQTLAGSAAPVRRGRWSLTGWLD